MTARAGLSLYKVVTFTHFYIHTWQNYLDWNWWISYTITDEN